MITEAIYTKVDAKIALIAEERKSASVILINSDAYKHMQQEMLERDMSQTYGKIRSPHEGLRSYKGIQILTSQVVADVEVF